MRPGLAVIVLMLVLSACASGTSRPAPKPSNIALGVACHIGGQTSCGRVGVAVWLPRAADQVTARLFTRSVQLSTTHSGSGRYGYRRYWSGFAKVALAQLHPPDHHQLGKLDRRDLTNRLSLGWLGLATPSQVWVHSGTLAQASRPDPGAFQLRMFLVTRRRSIAVAGALAGLALLAASASGSSRASGKTTPHGFLLTALAGVGTVYWRSRCASEYSLGFHVSSTGTTTGITFRSGHRVLRRTVQPGYSTIWSPFRNSRRQWLSTVSGGEAETIYAKVAVRFNEAHSLPNCYAYAPPRVSLTLYGRDHFG
jgi:hypothetical protein